MEGDEAVDICVSASVDFGVHTHGEGEVDLAVAVVFVCFGRVAKIAEGGGGEDEVV